MRHSAILLMTRPEIVPVGTIPVHPQTFAQTRPETVPSESSDWANLWPPRSGGRRKGPRETRNLALSFPLTELERILQTIRTWSRTGCEVAEQWWNHLKNPICRHFRQIPIPTTAQARSFNRQPRENVKALVCRDTLPLVTPTKIPATVHDQRHVGLHLGQLADPGPQIPVHGPLVPAHRLGQLPESH